MAMLHLSSNAWCGSHESIMSCSTGNEFQSNDMVILSSKLK